MYNTDLPTRAELPSSRQLVRSSVLAAIAAGALLTTTVLPAEYGIDPTGIGSMLGLTEMGEIKTSLAAEAAADAQVAAAPATGAEPMLPLPAADVAAPASPARAAGVDPTSVAAAAPPAGAVPAEPAAVDATPGAQSHEMIVTLKPGQAAEVKLDMRKHTKVPSNGRPAAARSTTTRTATRRMPPRTSITATARACRSPATRASCRPRSTANTAGSGAIAAKAMSASR